jgi:hypothetical protein
LFCCGSCGRADFDCLTGQRGLKAEISPLHFGPSFTIFLAPSYCMGFRLWKYFLFISAKAAQEKEKKIRNFCCPLVFQSLEPIQYCIFGPSFTVFQPFYWLNVVCTLVCPIFLVFLYESWPQSQRDLPN